MSPSSPRPTHQYHNSKNKSMSFILQDQNVFKMDKFPTLSNISTLADNLLDMTS